MQQQLSQGAVVYYGLEPRDKTEFQNAQVIILEPAHWSTRSLAKLQSEGKLVLGYLSIGELIKSTRTRKNYDILSTNKDWDSLRINPEDPAWVKTMLWRTQLAKQRGLDGMMLDTVDTVLIHPEAEEAMTQLIHKIRGEMPDGYLMMNRGFSIAKSVSRSIDGVLFENATNTSFSPNDKEWVKAQCELLKGLGLAVLTVDYRNSCDPQESDALVEQYGWTNFIAETQALNKPAFRE